MVKDKMPLVILTTAAVLSALSMVSAQEVLRLTQDQVWQAPSEYQLAVSRIKQLLDTGKCAAARKAFNKLKKSFPEVADSDFDAFIKVEVLRCRGKLTKAAENYGKFLTKRPQSVLYEAALQSQFHIGQEFLAGRKKRVLGFIPMSGHAEGVDIMDAITHREGLNEPNGIGVRAAKAAAESYQKKGASDPEYYDSAYFRWLHLYKESQRGRQLNKEALLGMARSRYAKYRGPAYDASCLANVEGTGAKSYYKEYKERYSKDDNELAVDEILEKIDDQLARKQLAVAQYYQKTGSTQAAKLYYQMVIDSWPNSTVAQRAKKMLTASENSRETKK